MPLFTKWNQDLERRLVLEQRLGKYEVSLKHLCQKMRTFTGSEGGIMSTGLRNQLEDAPVTKSGTI